MSLILVTGGAGFIGSHSVEALIERGHRVRILDNLSAGKLENLPPLNDDLEFVHGDIRDSEAVDAAMNGTNACLHLAAQVSVIRSIDDPAVSAENNILGFINVLQAAKNRHVKRMVYASSAAVYGAPESLPLDEQAPTQPLSPYGVEKLVDEHYAALFSTLHGLSTLGLRYFNVYGPRQDPSSPYAGVISRFADRLRAGQAPIIFGDGEQTRDFVYVADVAYANAAAVTSDARGILNVATGTRISLMDLLQALSSATGHTTAPAFEQAREGDIRHSVGDPARFHRQLGISAQWPLDRGLATLLDMPRLTG